MGMSLCDVVAAAVSDIVKVGVAFLGKRVKSDSAHDTVIGKPSTGLVGPMVTNVAFGAVPLRTWVDVGRVLTQKFPNDEYPLDTQRKPMKYFAPVLSGFSMRFSEGLRWAAYRGEKTSLLNGGGRDGCVEGRSFSSSSRCGPGCGWWLYECEGRRIPRSNSGVRAWTDGRAVVGTRSPDGSVAGRQA